MKKGILLTATVLGSLFVSTYAVAGASGNIGVTSNYIWRGVSQTGDGAAVSGGLDYEADNGLYVGTWASNVDIGGTKGTEVDLYAGYAKELKNGFGYDVAVTGYTYPGKNLSGDFTELSLKGSYKGVEAGVAYTLDSDDNTTPMFSKGDVYSHLGVSKELANGLTLGATVGHYNFDDAAGDDYSHAQLSVAKDDFTFAIDKANGCVAACDEDTRVSVAWSKSFDF